jgi:molybdopterin-guanine dinucleotide biosynthesis protein A
VKAYILAGGAGSRLARGKGFLKVAGVPIVERVRAAVAPLADEVVLVGPAEQLAEVGLRTVTEAQPGAAGPLGGLCAALADADPDDAVVLPWDAPFVSTAALRFLTEAKGRADAVVPRRGEQAEPLFAVYGPGCLGPAQEALQRAERRVISFYPKVAVRWVRPEELRPYGDWDALFYNVNTPADLARAQRMAGARGEEL